MSKLKEKIQEFWQKKRRGKDIIPFVISFAITILLFLCLHFWGNHFVYAIWTLNGILLSVIMLIVMITAGFEVLKSLFFVAAQLSLLIFLGQSYCDVSRSNESDVALRILLSIGFLYIVVNFTYSLYKTLKTKNIEIKEKQGSLSKIFTITLFLVFVILFIWDIYLVIRPIIFDLCIYKY